MSGRRVLIAGFLAAVLAGGTFAVLALRGGGEERSLRPAEAQGPRANRSPAKSAGSVSIRFVLADSYAAGGAGLGEAEADGLSKTTIAMLDLDPASIEAIASFALESGGQHELYLARNRSGETCLVEERPVGQTPDGDPLGIYGGGCSPGALAPNELKISVSAAGDPDAPGTQGVSIVGVVGSDVRNVIVLLRNGNARPVELTAGNSFHYVVSPTAIGADASPVEFQAFDNQGRKVSEASLR